jgi:crossover junction endodeoxyribonuclease RuvC
VKIAALDLSLTSTGVALTDGDVCTLKAKRVGMERLDWLEREIWFCVADADIVILEGYSFGSTGRAVFQIGELGGVIRFKLWREGIPFVEVPPTVLKKLATGKGNASKDEVFAAAIRRLNYQGNSNDEADAMWLRYAGLIHYGQTDLTLPTNHLEALVKVEWPTIEEMAA